MGATVTWTNQDADAHTATSDTGGVFDSGHLALGQSYTHTFNQVGSFTYKCTYHANMHGTIVVGGAATPTLSPTPALTLTLTPPALDTTVAGAALAPSSGAVSIVNYVYQPSTLTVAVGAVVTWTNMDVDAHTATSDTPGVFDSGHMAQAGTFSFTFNQPGTFAYHCTYHANMHGSIVVQAAGAATPGLPAPAAAQTAAQLAAPAVAGVSIAPAPALVHDARYFVATGYRVDDDVLFDYYQHRGGLEVFGYPVSREFTFMGCQLQIFQRKAAQACPGQQPEFLNLLDPEFPPLTNVNGSTFPAPDPALKSITPSVNDPDYAAKIIDFVRANAPDTFEGEPVNFGQTFFGSITADMVVPEALGTLDLLNLEVWGAPISQPQRDPNNSKFIYQRFQRGIMHYDATTGATRGILLADYFKQILLDSPNLPPDVRQESVSSPFLKQYCPGSAGWLCRPDDLPATDLTYGFAVDPSIMAVGGVPVAAPANGSSVNIVDFSFDPASLSVATGTTVRWTNRGRLPHNVTDSGGEWHSDLLRTGQSFEHRFDTPGTYTYVCSVHPGMEATLVVTGDAVSAAPAPPAPAAPASAGGGAAAPVGNAAAPAAAPAPAANAPAPAAAAAPAANAPAPAAAPAANAGAGAAQSSASVAIVNFAYQPSPLTVPVGATVTWTNQDTDPHTATSDTAGVFDSGLMPKDKTFSFTFSQAGTFTYKCTYHSNMHGTIVVQSS
ncbi:MAG: hypothetical protein E6I52_13435 [Chloroflexi bacterium]|nr:MAG: hypothetical protein E6I52_13435 [Chloroflexota bacterium]